MIARSLRRFAGICTFTLALVCGTCALAAEPARGPSGCPPGVDATKYVCLTREEMQAHKLGDLDKDDQIIDLKRQVGSLKARVPRFGKLWATVGMEYLPNATEAYHPYALGGLAIGRVDVWAGTFGADPAVGLGWRF